MCVHAYVNTWNKFTFAEMKPFLAILLLVGLTKQLSFELYWSTDEFIQISETSCHKTDFWGFCYLSENSTAKPRNHPEPDRAFKI